MIQMSNTLRPLKLRPCKLFFRKLHSNFCFIRKRLPPITTYRREQNFTHPISKPYQKIGILSPKVYTKNVPNIDICNFILAPLRTLSIKQVIVVLYYNRVCKILLLSVYSTLQFAFCYLRSLLVFPPKILQLARFMCIVQ